MSFVKLIFLLATVPVVVLAQSPFTICKLTKILRFFIHLNSVLRSGEPHLPQPTSVHVFNCNSQFCIFRRDRAVSYQAQFIPRSFSSDIYVYVYLFVDGRWYNWNNGHDVFGCRSLIQGRCPIFQNQFATIASGIVLPRNLPTGRIMAMQIRALNQLLEDVFCFRINGFVEA